MMWFVIEQNRILNRLVQENFKRNLFIMYMYLMNVFKVKLVQFIGVFVIVSDEFIEDFIEFGWGDYVIVIQFFFFEGKRRNVSLCIEYQYVVCDYLFGIIKVEVFVR